jgi:hypothetical protein
MLDATVFFVTETHMAVLGQQVVAPLDMSLWLKIICLGGFGLEDLCLVDCVSRHDRRRLC